MSEQPPTAEPENSEDEYPGFIVIDETYEIPDDWFQPSSSSQYRQVEQRSIHDVCCQFRIPSKLL